MHVSEASILKDGVVIFIKEDIVLKQVVLLCGVEVVWLDSHQMDVDGSEIRQVVDGGLDNMTVFEIMERGSYPREILN